MQLLSGLDFLDHLEHNGQECLFHGLASANLAEVARLSDLEGDGKIHLFGRSTPDDEDDEGEGLEHLFDDGYLYCTRYERVELSVNEFSDDESLILILGANVPEPEIRLQGHAWNDKEKEHIIKVQEWVVVGGVRFSQDEEYGGINEEEVEYFTVEEILRGEY